MIIPQEETIEVISRLFVHPTDQLGLIKGPFEMLQIFRLVMKDIDPAQGKQSILFRIGPNEPCYACRIAGFLHIFDNLFIIGAIGVAQGYTIRRII